MPIWNNRKEAGLSVCAHIHQWWVQLYKQRPAQIVTWRCSKWVNKLVGSHSCSYFPSPVSELAPIQVIKILFYSFTQNSNRALSCRVPPDQPTEGVCGEHRLWAPLWIISHFQALDKWILKLDITQSKLCIHYCKLECGRILASFCNVLRDNLPKAEALKWTLTQADILTRHSRKSTRGNNQMSQCWIVFRSFGFKVLVYWES